MERLKCGGIVKEGVAVLFIKEGFVFVVDGVDGSSVYCLREG